MGLSFQGPRGKTPKCFSRLGARNLVPGAGSVKEILLFLAGPEEERPDGRLGPVFHRAFRRLGPALRLVSARLTGGEGPPREGP